VEAPVIERLQLDADTRGRHGLLEDLGDDARPHGTPTLTDRETKTLLHRDRLDQLHRQLNVIPRHHHPHTLRQRHHTRHISRTEVELRPIPREERRMPPPLLLLQDVNRTTETRMRRDRTRLRQHLTPLDIITDRKSTRLNSSHVKISYAV